VTRARCHRTTLGGLETSLDLDAVSSACPNCHMVQGTDNSLDNLGIAADTAVSMGAKFVSNSYGVPGEDSSELGFDHHYDHPGEAVTASTGDAGNVTNWPATSPNDWAGVTSAANGKLQVSSGVINNSLAVTNEGWEYDPASDSWADLPAANNAEYRGGGSCGMYKIGGSTGGFGPTPFSEVLPGYDQCGGGADVPWLSEDPASYESRLGRP
jgi:hypothetical protein